MANRLQTSTSRLRGGPCVRTQMEGDATLGQPSYQTADAGAAGLETQLMSMNNSQRDRIIEITMGHEGEKTEGTSYGITQKTLNRYNGRYGDAGFPTDVALLGEKQARQIARQLYYEEFRIGDVDEFSVAAHVFDMVFNSSTVGAALMLQDAMWETIKGTDLQTAYTRDTLPGGTVP